jgi:hypothetical protein
MEAKGILSCLKHPTTATTDEYIPHPLPNLFKVKVKIKVKLSP